MKKYERITHYLNELKKKNREKLLNIEWRDLRKLRRFNDIGDRTLLNIVKDYKKNNKDLFPFETDKKALKKEIVENFLEKYYANYPDRFHDLRSRELLLEPELEGIGKTTIVCSLSKFKRENKVRKKKRSKNERPKENISFKRSKVEEYLTKQLASTSISEFYDLKPKDIFNAPALRNISKATISDGLTKFKRRFFVGIAIEHLKRSKK